MPACKIMHNQYCITVPLLVPTSNWERIHLSPHFEYCSCNIDKLSHYSKWVKKCLVKENELQELVNATNLLWVQVGLTWEPPIIICDEIEAFRDTKRRFWNLIQPPCSSGNNWPILYHKIKLTKEMKAMRTLDHQEGWLHQWELSAVSQNRVNSN